MSSPRRGRSAIVKTTSESEKTVAEEPADMETADSVVDLTGEQEVAGNGGTEKEMIIDLEVKDSTPIVTKSPGSTKTAVKEQSLTMDVKDESDVTVVAATIEPTDTGSQESVDTNKTADGPSTQTATTTTAEPIKEQPKPEAKPPTAAVVTKPEAKPPTAAVVTKSEAKPSKAAVVTKTRTKSLRGAYPESLTKLRNLTVNIGPIRLLDLKSEKLHDVLKMNDKFEIKFEMLSKKEADGKIVKEKSGFIRLPFEITTPNYLIKVAYMLGHLDIDGRDMSVKFPEAFNTAVADCKKYEQEAKLLQMKKADAFKRQISVKNVPADVTEETIRTLFPEVQTITLKMGSKSEGSKVGSVRLEFETEKACIKCMEKNKDVFIGDNQLKIYRLFLEKKPKNNRGLGSGRGKGNTQSMRGRGGLEGTARGRGAVRGRGAARGRGIASTRGMSASVPSSRNTSRMGSGAMGRPSTTSGSRASYSYQGQFKDFIPPNRQGNRARQPASRGNLGYGQQRRDLPQSSPYRSDRSPQQKSVSYRADTSYSPAISHQSSSNRGEDPSAIMQYIQTTLARMEQKISSRDTNDRSHDLQGAQSRNGGQFGGGQFGGMSGGSPAIGNSNSSNIGRGNQSRKRVGADNRDYSQQAKRQFVSGMTDQSRGDSRSTNYYGSQQNMNTGGNMMGTVADYQSSNVGNMSGAYGGGGSGRRDSYGNSGRSDNSNTGYSASQFTSSGGGSGTSGWGQMSNMSGYNQNNIEDRQW